MVLHTPVMSDKQSIMFKPLHSSSNKELFEKHFSNPRIPKEINGTMRPNYINYRLKMKHHYASLSAMFNPLHSSTNQELFEKHLCNSCTTISIII